jgi:hypothetical protein
MSLLMAPFAHRSAPPRARACYPQNDKLERNLDSLRRSGSIQPDGCAGMLKSPVNAGLLPIGNNSWEIIKTKARLSKYSRAVARAAVLRQHVCICHQLKVATPNAGRCDDFFREISVDVETSH